MTLSRGSDTTPVSTPTTTRTARQDEIAPRHAHVRLFAPAFSAPLPSLIGVSPLLQREDRDRHRHSPVDGSRWGTTSGLRKSRLLLADHRDG
jgi:hypothetical protein